MPTLWSKKYFPEVHFKEVQGAYRCEAHDKPKLPCYTVRAKGWVVWQWDKVKFGWKDHKVMVSRNSTSKDAYFPGQASQGIFVMLNASIWKERLLFKWRHDGLQVIHPSGQILDRARDVNDMLSRPPML